MSFAPKPPGDRPEDWIAAAVGITPQREDRPGYFGAVGQNSADVLHDWLPEWLPQGLRQGAGIATATVPGLSGLVQAAALTGGVLTAGRQEALRPAFGAAVGGANRFTNWLNQSRGMTGRTEEPTEWTREGLARFSEEEAKRFGWGGEFIEGMLTDPLTYVPVGGAARRIAGVGEALAARGTLGAVAGAPLRAAGEAGRLYGEITDLPVRALGRGIQEGVKRTPVLRDVFGTSLQGQVSREVGRVGRSLNELLNLSRSKVDQLGNVSPVRQSFEEFTSPKELPLPAGVAQWGALRNMIQSIGDRITKFDNPYRQGLAISLVDDVVDRKNWFEAEAAARRQGLREELAAGQITPQEAADLTNETFTYQGRNVAALYQATLEALDHLEAQEYPKVAPAIAGEIKERVRVGLQRMHDEALTKRDMDMYLDPADPQQVLFRRKDPEELEVLEAARDTLYRDARTAQRGYLSDLLDRIDELMGAPDESTQGLMGAVTESWRERVGELGQFARPARERLGVMSQEGAEILRDQLPALERSQRRHVLVRERVKATATPILLRHYRDAGQTAEAAVVSAAHDLRSREALLKKLDELDRLRTLPGPWEEVGRIRRDLDRYRGLDPLKPSDSFNLTMHEFAEKYATARGLKAPPPWLTWFFTSTGIWRDLALLSPRFNMANLLWGLFSGQMDDVQAQKVMRTLGRNFQDVNTQMADGKGVWGWARAAAEERGYAPRYRADLVPELRKLGLTDDQDNWLMPYPLAKSIDAMQSIGRGQQEQAATAGGGVVSRIPHAGWSAGTSALLGVTAYNEADDLEGEERLNHALRAAGVGAVAGLGVRPLVWGNRLLTKSIEGALRTEAVVQGMLKALPAEREALIRKVLEAAPLEQPTIGKPVTVGHDLLGRVPVTRMRHLTSAFPDEPLPPPDVDPAEVARARVAWIQRDEGKEAVDDALDVGENPSTVLPKGDVRLMRPDDIVADPARFQFKSDVEARTGAGKSLSGVTSWETDSEGVILVWDDPADGRTYVVDGHHRLAKARELGVQEILTRRINAGTAEEARARGALSNLRTENATATDAAKVMRQYGWGKEELRQQGVPLKKDLVVQALALRDLDDGLFQRVTLGEITPEIGAALATASPDPSGQRALLELVTGESAKGREITPRLIETLGRQVRNAGTVQMEAEGTAGLANTALFDLVGGTATTKSLALDKATATEIVRREIADEARRFKALAEKRTVERAGEVAGQVLQPQENAQRATDAGLALADFDRALDNPLATGVQGVLDDLARQLAGQRRKTLRPDEVRAAAARIKEALVGDQGALSSRNAWEAATTRAPAAAAEAAPAPTGMEDMFGGAVEEATPAAEQPSLLGEVETAPGSPEREAEFRERFPVAQSLLNREDARARHAAARSALSDARLAVMKGVERGDSEVALAPLRARMDEAEAAEQVAYREMTAGSREFAEAARALQAVEPAPTQTTEAAAAVPADVDKVALQEAIKQRPEIIAEQERVNALWDTWQARKKANPRAVATKAALTAHGDAQMALMERVNALVDAEAARLAVPGGDPRARRDALLERLRGLSVALREHDENYPNLRDFDNRGVDDPAYQVAVRAHQSQREALAAARRAVTEEAQALRQTLTEPDRPAAAAAAPQAGLGPVPADFQPSKGHVGVFGQWEYFYGPSGDLMRAPLDNVIEVGGGMKGYRSGRVESAPANAERTIAAAREALGERPVPGAATAAAVPERPPVRIVTAEALNTAIDAMNLPDHVKDTLRQNVALAGRMGLIDTIEDLAAQGLTVRQIGNRLQSSSGGPGSGVSPADFQEMARSVRTALGIPSIDEPAEFAAWLRRYNEAVLTPAERARGEVPTMPSAHGRVADRFSRIIEPLTEAELPLVRAYIQNRNAQVLATIAKSRFAGAQRQAAKEETALARRLAAGETPLTREQIETDLAEMRAEQARLQPAYDAILAKHGVSHDDRDWQDLISPLQSGEHTRRFRDFNERQHELAVAAEQTPPDHSAVLAWRSRQPTEAEIAAASTAAAAEPTAPSGPASTRGAAQTQASDYADKQAVASEVSDRYDAAVEAHVAARQAKSADEPALREAATVARDEFHALHRRLFEEEYRRLGFDPAEIEWGGVTQGLHSYGDPVSQRLQDEAGRLLSEIPVRYRFADYLHDPALVAERVKDRKARAAIEAYQRAHQALREYLNVTPTGAPMPPTAAAAPARPAVSDDVVRQLGFQTAEELEAERALLERTPRLAEHSYDTLLTVKQAVGDRLRRMKAAEGTLGEGDIAQMAKDERLLADLTAHRDARLAAWEHARGEAARTEVAGTGKLTMTRQEMERATANQGDVYRDARLGKEVKGISASGEEILGYPYQPDLFIKSDLSGKMVRHYVTLPDGRIAHPDEIYEAQQRGNIIISDLPAHIPDDYRGYRSKPLAAAESRREPQVAAAIPEPYAERTPADGTPTVAPLTAGAGAAEARPPAPAPPAPPSGPSGPPSGRVGEWPPNEPLPDEPLEVAPAPRVRPPMLRIGMSEPSPVLRYEMTPEQKEGIVAFIEREQHFSQTELAQEALRLGVRPQMADAVGRDWANGIRGAEDAGLSLNDRINYDYSDVSNATEALRNLGIFPFATWAIKTAPRVMHWLLQDPRFFIAIDRLNQVSQTDIQESGLSPSYSRLVGLGPLGDAIAEHLLGRPDASVMGQPWAMFMPFTEIGRPSRTQEDAGLIERALDVGGTFGASLGPLPSLAARLTGQTSEYGGSVLRTSPYLEALTLAATGRPVDPEAGLKRGIRGVREVLGAEDEPTLTGSPIKDYAIRQRIAELAIERTGKPAAGEYLLAMDMPTHRLWQEAEATVNRQMAGQTTAAAVIPFRTKALSDTAEAVGRARLRQGIAPGDLAAVPKEERAALWKRAERAEPLVGAFSSTGGDERGVLARQFQQWSLVKRKTQRLSPKARAQQRAAFLDEHQVLQEYLAKHPLY